MADVSPLELHAAVCCNDIDQLQTLLESHTFNVNEKDTEWGYRTPLHWAAQKGFTECAKLLLESGAKGTLRMAHGVTPAHCAAEAGKLPILKLLVRSKISVTRSDDFGDRPLDKAKIFGQKSCFDYLQQCEDEATARRKVRREKLLKEKRQDLVAKSKKSTSKRCTDEQREELERQVQLLVLEIGALESGDTYPGSISDEDVNDDPMPYNDKAYLAWMATNARNSPVSRSSTVSGRASASRRRLSGGIAKTQ